MSRKNTIILGLLSTICVVPAIRANAVPAGTPGAPYAIPLVSVPTMMIYDKFDSEIRIGARVKADLNYDSNGKQPGTTYGLDPAAIPLYNWDYDAQRNGNFNFSMTSSRISLDVKHQYGCLESVGYAEIDFNGGLASGVRTSNNYLPRIRHFYWELSDTNKTNDWLFGQTWTNFSSPEVNPWSTNNIWPTFRTAQARYTRKFIEFLTLSVALERPNTQYFSFGADGSGAVSPNTGTVGYFDNDTANSFSKSSMPDFTFNLKYHRDVTLFAFRGVLRRLDVKTIAAGGPGGNGGFGATLNGQNNARDNYTKSKTAWGLGASAMFRIANPLTFMLQVQGGNGIGRYIDDLANQNPFDSYFEFPTTATSRVGSNFETLKAINFIGGFTIKWRHDLETNIGAAFTKIEHPKTNSFVDTPGATTGAQIQLPHRMLQRYHINLNYMIVPKGFMIFEVEQYYRQAGYNPKYKGRDTRLIVSFIRNF